jgi:hypothetical protein
VLKDDVRQVLQRRVVPAPGPRVTPSGGVDVLGARVEGQGVRLSVRSAEGGTVLVNRLDWPGWSATTDDGAAVEVHEGAFGLVELTVPRGSTVIHLGYAVPGLHTGLTAAVLALLSGLAHQLVRRRRPGRAAGAAPAARGAAGAPGTAPSMPVPRTSSARVTLPSQKSVSTPSPAEADRATT